MIPELPSIREPEVEPHTMYRKGQSQEDASFARKSNHNYHTNSSLHCVSFERATDDNANIGDSVLDYNDTDIKLMQEGLSILLDDDDGGNKDVNENSFSIDRGGFGNKYANTRYHRSAKEDTRYVPFSSTLVASNRSSWESYHPVSTCKEKEIESNVESKTTIDLHPMLLPQVTFDEEEEFDRKTFFDPVKPERRPSYKQKRTPQSSSRQKNEPSDWLLRQVASTTLPFEYSTRKSRSVRENKADIRASLVTKHKHWTPEEDKILKLATETELLQPIDWVQIARDYFNNSRSATQCKNRWKNVSCIYYLF